MDKDKYIGLIYKKLKKEINPEEQKKLEAWMAADKEHAQLQQDIVEDWSLTKKALPPISIDVKGDFKGFKQRMQQEKRQTTSKPKVAKKQEAIIRPMNRRRILSIAAAIALPLVAGLWLFMSGNPVVEMVIAETSAGQSKTIQLMDGTQVTLNENSTLEYPATFAANSRVVSLKGEAYFEVSSNPNRPFEVETNTTTIKVLGTVFNVRNLAGGDVSVSVEEGKVQVSAKTSQQSVILTKGEIGNYDLKSQQLTEKKVNNKNASAWKSKVLTYKKVPLKQVLTDLSQQFKVETSIQNASMKDCLVTARFTDAQPKAVLEYLVQLYKMDLKVIDANTFELSNGICQ